MFTTPVEIKPFGHAIDHRSRVVSLGSCFATNIAQKMRRAKFTVCDNPFGVLFNPLSVASTLDRLATGVADHELFEHDGLWSSFAFHGSFSSVSREQALAAMDGALRQGSRCMAEADRVIVTFGTAWVYEADGRVVANCHKLPASTFVRRRLSVGEIVARYDGLFDGVLAGRQVIFTVSPVRHVRDGLAENSLGKAILLEAVHELVAHHAGAHYFPAFEIMNDELRDYRFYADDMVHPSPVAIDHIWRRFGQAAFSASTRALAADAEAIATAMEHRPLNPESAAHRRFLAAMRDRVSELRARCPDLDLTAETDYFGG